MHVHDVDQVLAHEDQVHAGVGAGPRRVLGERLPIGCTIVNDTFTGFPAGIGPDGVRPEMWLTPVPR